MRLTPASRHMSTCRRACATSVVPTFSKTPRPPNVIVPIVSTETRRPDRPSARYSMGEPYPPRSASRPPARRITVGRGRSSGKRGDHGRGWVPWVAAGPRTPGGGGGEQGYAARPGGGSWGSGGGSAGDGGGRGAWGAGRGRGA